MATGSTSPGGETRRAPANASPPQCRPHEAERWIEEENARMRNLLVEILLKDRLPLDHIARYVT